MTLHIGNSGATVRRLQERLNDHGAQLFVDGGFGPITKAAVVAFQVSKSLATDGIVGPRTWAALGKELEPSTVEYPSGLVLPTVAAAPAIYNVPHPNSAGPLVQLTDELREAQVSDHFKLGEFACHDPRYDLVRLAPALVVALETMRTRLGDRPIFVSSGHRPTAYNTHIGGATKSSHIDGCAADWRAAGCDVEAAYAAACAVLRFKGGVGRYPRPDGRYWVHADTRLGTYARWTG